MRKRPFEALAGAAAMGVAVPAFAQSAAPQPTMSASEAVRLFEEAGFRVEGGRPFNRCGGPSNPRVGFIDLNGDGNAEAHLADVDPRCYGKPGAYFAILARQADGGWKRLIAEDGIVGFERARTYGWNDLSLEARDSACPGTRRFNGTDYGAPTACGTFAEAPASEAAAPAAPYFRGPLSREKLFDWTGDPLPEARALPTAERNAIFRAAGIQQVGGGKWTGCPDDPSAQSEAQLALFQDLNGDGRPEAAVFDNGSYCNGHAGVASTVLTRTPEGTWQVLYSNQGFASFLVSRGADGFPDIVAGLPGFCFPYFRWDGRDYDLVATLDDDGRPCEPF
jgi:hypothetical protein